jgi:hypothetical protein
MNKQNDFHIEYQKLGNLTVLSSYSLDNISYFDLETKYEKLKFIKTTVRKLLERLLSDSQLKRVYLIMEDN